MEHEQRVRILILDSARSVRNGLKERLLYEGFEVDAYETLEEGYAACRDRQYDLLLIDGALGDEHVSSMRQGMFGKASPIILAANPSMRQVIHSIRDGAWDFVPKPVDMNQMLSAIRDVLSMREEERKYVPEPDRRVQTMAKAVAADTKDESGIIGSSKSVNKMKEMVERIGPKDTWVMIMGPNGTGKELVAKWLHKKSSRSNGPFVEVNCAAIPSELIESELFGHEKGSFSSAIRQHKGKFEQANGGTLFLDEVGDMSLAAQAKVLRALQEHKVARVGGDKDIEVDVRVVSATNKNLLAEIDAGRFREDLYHRLAVIVIPVPSLEDRSEDIPLLVDYFLDKICRAYDMEPKPIEHTAIELLQKRIWSGNIRELQNVVERLVVLSSDRITEEDVEAYASPPK